MIGKQSYRAVTLCCAALLAACTEGAVGGGRDSAETGASLERAAVEEATNDAPDADAQDVSGRPDRPAVASGSEGQMAAGAESRSAELRDESKQQRQEDSGARAGEPVGGLPWAGTRSFDTLDEYLAYLDHGAAIGKPHYKEIEPDLFVLVPGKMTDAPKNDPITREALAQKLGFSESE